MDLERITLRLRVRTGWEAIDLGLRLTARHARAVWGAWFAATLPLTLVVWAACWSQPGLALLLLWWVKPVSNRFVLHVLAQAVFGETPSVARTLGAWRQVLRHGLGAALLWRRWDPARSFHQPIAQLEQQTGRAAAQRRRALGRNAWGQAVWLSVVTRLFAVALFLSAAMLVRIFTPESIEAEVPANGMWDLLSRWSWDDSLASYLVLCLTEPFYVGAGFALYLNRRVQIEGWDIELALRLMNARVAALADPDRHSAQRMRAAVSALVAGAVVSLVLGLFPAFEAGLGVAQAQEVSGQQDPAQVIKEVLAGPDFGSTRDDTSWRFIPEEQRKELAWNLRWLKRWFDFAAQGGQVIGWIVLVIALMAILRFVLLTWGRHEGARAAAWQAPEVLFGLAIAPQTLPEDIAGAARALALAGDIRGALSLLYRGVLSQLVHQHQVRLSEGDTERDTLQRAAPVLGANASALLAELVQAWQLTAYAARPVDAATASLLCDAWAQEFGRASKGAEAAS
jgi:hypothetical protein